MAHSGGLCQQQLPDAALRLLCQQRPAQQYLSRHGAPTSNIFPMALRHGAPAGNSFPMAIRHSALAGQQLCLVAPVSNKPHSAEKSPPVWLAIWRTWAGFANSQLWRATIRCTY